MTKGAVPFPVLRGSEVSLSLPSLIQSPVMCITFWLNAYSIEKLFHSFLPSQRGFFWAGWSFVLIYFIFIIIFFIPNS